MSDHFEGRIIEVDRLSGKSHTVSVICPMYNEGPVIAANLDTLARELGTTGRPWEIVVVNDGSTDNSLEEARAATRKHGAISIVTYDRNRGRGFALRKGMEHARGDIVVTTESDLSYGVKIVEELARLLESDESDAAVASPYCRGGSFRGVPWVRLCLSKVANRVFGLLMPIRLTCYTGMTRAYWRRTLDGIDLESDDKEIHLEIIAKLAAVGAKVSELPANAAWTPGTGRRRSSLKLRRHLIGHILYGMGEAPFLAFSSFSFFLLVIGGALGLRLLFLSATGTKVGDRPLLFFAILLILSALFVFLFGVIAGQVKRLQRDLHRLTGRIRSSPNRND